jgi:hypothetical protein
MYRKLSSKSTFKPQLEALETRDLPSVAGVALYMEGQNIQHGVQAMQAQANAAQTDFAKWGSDLQNGLIGSARTDQMKLAGEIQSIRLLNTQVQAELQVFQQSAFAVASDGDQTDQALALFSFLQVNGGLGSLFGGSSSGSASSQAQSALGQADQIAANTNLPLPGPPSGITIPVTSIDQMLNG